MTQIRDQVRLERHRHLIKDLYIGEGLGLNLSMKAKYCIVLNQGKKHKASDGGEM